MNYVRSFKDELSVYFLVEYIKGHELYSAIRIMDELNTEEAMYYTASMILCMEYLHD